MRHEELNQGMMRAYLDGQLDSQQVAAIEQHLEGCAACREQLGILRGHAALLQDCLDRLPESAGDSQHGDSLGRVSEEAGGLDGKRAE